MTMSISARIEIEARFERPTFQGAAAALREARRRLRGGLDAADACGWAISMLPESRAAQRLMLDWLLASGQASAAATLAHTLLHAGGDDWRLWLRRAEALLALERIDEASTAIERTLAARPHHRRALLLKADIAARRHDHFALLAALECADTHHARDGEIARRLIEALLACDRPEDAAAVLEELPDAEPELQAAVLVAQGRLLDARITLQDAIGRESDEHRRAHLQLGLIDVLEQSADWPALRSLQASAEIDPLVAARLVESCLKMGAFDAAERLIATSDAGTHRHAHVVAAIEAIRGEAPPTAACASISRAGDRELKPAARAEPWLRSLMGLAISEQIDAQGVRRAGADPALNVLDALLPAAIATFEVALQDQPDSPKASQWQDMHHAAWRAMQQPDNLGAAIEHAQTIEHAIRRAA